MKYAIINVGGTMRVHKADCQDVKKDRAQSDTSWTREAFDTKQLIRNEKQSFYEDAGGNGAFELDMDLENEPRSFAEQYFEILPCAKYPDNTSKVQYDERVKEFGF